MMALVGTGVKEEFPPNKVVFWDDSQLKIVGEINFKEKILGMKLREDKIMVVLSKQVQVYDLKSLERIVKYETVNNLLGIAAVNSDKNQAIFACLAQEIGNIKVINFDRNNEVMEIKAHKSQVTALALNWQGSLVATASLEGQVVRVFRTSDGQMI
jgi:WD40 repeat protein